MLIRTSTRYASQFTMGMDVAGREFLSLVVKGTFDFPGPGQVARRSRDQRPLILADVYDGPPGYSAPKWETDFAFRKAACDVVLQGAAYAPGGQPAERVRVGLRVGDWVKQFDVVGPRQWRTLGPSVTATRPYPFTRLAFSYDTAFGGPDRSWQGEGAPVFVDNPYGLGFAAARSGSRIDGLDLPLTEDPADPVTSPFGAHRPIPFLPADFDERYYQCAPEDQQIAPPAPGLPVVILGLTPQGREEFRLPDTALPVRIFRGRETALAATLRPDTLCFDTEARQFTLTWRCDVAIRHHLTEFSEAWVGPPSRGLLRALANGKAYVRPDPLAPPPKAAA
jgi:hypothetical protein